MEQYVFGEVFSEPLEKNRIDEIIRFARLAKMRLVDHPLETIIALLDRVGRKLRDEEIRNRHVEALVLSSGYSREMIICAFEALCTGLTRSYLEEKIRRELGAGALHDGLDYGSGRNILVRYRPLGIVLHLASGNVFLTAVLTLIEGLLTRNTNIVKLSSQETYFAIEFAKLLHDLDDEGIISKSFALLNFSSQDKEILQTLKGIADGLVVWGGEKAVLELRRDLRVETKLIEFGPKLSFAVITEQGCKRKTMERIGLDLATVSAYWDQQACSSPQVVYLLMSEEKYREFLGGLKVALARIDEILPPGRKDRDETAEITKEKELARFREAIGEGCLIESPSSNRYTVICENDPAFRLSPLNRTLLVKRLSTLDELPSRLGDIGPFVQTVGIEAGVDEATRLVDLLAPVGPLRFTDISGMSGGIAGEPHDGMYTLQRLVNIVSVIPELFPKVYHPLEILDRSRLLIIVTAKLKSQIARAAETSLYYRKRFAGLGFNCMGDLKQFPILDRVVLPKISPPYSNDILCAAPVGSYVFKSGGSSGRPKYAIYSLEDVDADMEAAARGPFALGTYEGQKVATLFSAGSLYGSFISSIKILEKLGCQIFSLTSQASDEVIIETLLDFKIDVVLGIPASFLRLVRDHRDTFAKLGISTFLYAGEHMYREDIEILRSVGFSRILSFGYGSVDAGPIGYQCDHCSGSTHHLLADHQWLEIIDETTGLDQPPLLPGRLLITNLSRKLMPLLRYDIGDRGYWLEEPCPCGRTAPRFVLLGRGDDVFVCAHSNQEYSEYLEAVRRFPELSDTCQIEITKEDGIDCITLNVELKSANEVVRPEPISTALIEIIGPLKQGLSHGYLKRFELNLLKPNGIVPDPRSGKIKRVIDRRTL